MPHSKEEGQPHNNENRSSRKFSVGTQRGSDILITVMLIVPETRKAISLYKDALGARELWNLGGLAGLEICGSPFYLHEVNRENRFESNPADVGITSSRVEVFVDDPDSFIEQAIKAGATKGSPIEDHQRPRGTHRQGSFRDPFGHNWSVGDKSPLSQHVG